MIFRNSALLTRRFAMATALVLLSACTRHVSRDITPGGQAGKVIFPDSGRIVLKEGTFPNLDNLRAVGPGVTKEQLYYLLGRPHFREGYYGVREWDYLFHFRTPHGVRTCQYKVIFDERYLGHSFHWEPAECASVLKEAEPMLEPEPASVRRYELRVDTLFAFDRSEAADLLPGGRAEVNRIVGELAHVKQVRHVRVIGHTDMLGSESYNLALSQRRANTIRMLLIQGGVPSDVVFAEGRGESEPVRNCDMNTVRSLLVECLQPNRRVEVIADAMD